MTKEQEPIALRYPRDFLWKDVVARIAIDDKTGQIMCLEYTKHMNEKDLQRNLHSFRDIRTVPLHCTLVTPYQQLDQSFQTLAALLVDVTSQQTPQSQTAVHGEISVDSDRLGAIAKELFKSLISSAVSLDDAVIDPWMQATRHGRVDFAEIFCTSNSLLTEAVTANGGRAGTIQSLEWIRSRHEGRNRQIERGSSW